MLEFGSYPYANWVIAGIAVYMVVMLLVGWWASKRVKNASDFIVAGRRLPLWMYVGTLFATWFGAGTLMGGAANAYIFGMHGVIFDPYSAGFCLIIAGFFFVRLMRRGRFMTITDFFDIRYGKAMGILSVVIMIVVEMGFVGAQLVAFGAIIHIFTGLPLYMGIIIYQRGLNRLYPFGRHVGRHDNRCDPDGDTDRWRTHFVLRRPVRIGRYWTLFRERG